MTNNGQYDSPVKATLKGITDLFKKRERIGSLAPDERLDGKQVLITGASSGLGFATAVRLAKRGATIWMACRSGIPNKGEEVRQLSGSDNIHMLHIDLSDLHSIQACLDEIKSKNLQFDIIISNAAMVPGKSRQTKQGIEEMFMVNYLSKFIFLNELMNQGAIALGGTHPPRVIIVSSESHRNPKAFEWSSFGEYQPYGMGQSVERYGYYKLLLTTFAQSLSQKWNPNQSHQVSVFSMCPGPVNSNIAREAPGWAQPLVKVMFSLFFRSPMTASEPIEYLACSKAEGQLQSDYLFLMSRKEVAPLAQEQENQEKLWQLSQDLVNTMMESAPNTPSN